jgi:prevent-host-death family protein
MQRPIKATSIPATRLQREIGRVLRRVARDQEHITVEHNGFPIAVLVPLGDYATLMQDHQRVNQRVAETALAADVDEGW